MAPRLAIRTACRPDAAGKAGSDIVSLLALAFLVIHTRELVVAGWLAWVEGIGVGVGVLGSTLGRAISGHLAFVFIAGIGLTILAGRRRAVGRDFDLACVALVPLVMLELATAVALKITGATATPLVTDVTGAVAMGWGVAVVLLALQFVRSDDSKDEGIAGPRSASAGNAGWGLMVLALVMLSFNGAWIAGNYRLLAPVTVGDVAPNFRLPRIDSSGAVSSDTLTLSDLRGKVVVVDFWATWCGPCRAAMPAIERVYRRHRSRGLEVVSINTEGPDAAAKARAIVANTTFSLLSDTGAVSRMYRVSSIPHLALIDELGVVRYVHRGFSGEDTLDRQVDALLRAAGR